MVQDVELNEFMKRYKELNIQDLQKSPSNGNISKSAICCSRKPVFYSEMFRDVFGSGGREEGSGERRDQPYRANDEDLIEL